MRKFIIVSCMLVLLAHGVAAQNHLRTDEFLWDEIKTDQFTVIHPSGMVDKAREALFYLEEGLSRINRDLDFEFKRTVTVILYQSHNHFEQNSILGGAVPEGIGAFAETYQDRIVLPVESSRKRFRYLLQHELTHIVEFAALFPNRLPSWYIIRYPFYPDWFMEGLAEYEAEYYSTYRNMILRDRALDGGLKPMYKLFGFKHLNRHDYEYAYKQGGEFIRFLAVHDRTYPALLLKTFADHMPWRISSIIQAAIGVDYRALDQDFRDYLADRARKETEGRSDPEEQTCLTRAKDQYYYVYHTDAAWRPDGKEIAFIADLKEKNGIFLAKCDGSDPRPLFDLRVGFSIKNIHRGKGGNLAWSPDGSELYFVGEWHNRVYLYDYNFNTGDLNRRDLRFDEIRDITFAPKGDRIAFSGIRRGISDIYTYELASGVETRITSDLYDDFAPAWNPNGWALIYTSERKGQRELVIIDMEASKPSDSMEPVTDFMSDEMTASWNREGTMVTFVSDNDGFYGIYVMDLMKKVIYRQGLFKGGAFQPRFSPDNSQLLFSYFRHGQYRLQVMPVNISEAAAVTFGEHEGVRDDLSRYTQGLAGPETPQAFDDSWSWDAILPLGIFNWGQAGDTLGTSEFSVQLYPGFTDDYAYINGEIMYWNRMTRFDLGAGIRANSDVDFETDERTEDLSLVLEARYPFDLYRGVEAGLLTGTRRELDGSTKLSDKKRTGLFAALYHDNRLFRALSPVRGQRIEVGAQYFPVDNKDHEYYGYAYGFIEQALTIREDHILYLYARGDVSRGRDRIELDIADIVRGYPKGDYEGYGRVGGTIEYRFPLLRDGNFDILGHYLLLKDLRAFVFFDLGAVSVLGFDEFVEEAFAFDLDFRHSVGLGLQIDFYGMQKAPFGLRIGLAQVTDDSDEGLSAFFNLNIVF